MRLGLGAVAVVLVLTACSPNTQPEAGSGKLVVTGSGGAVSIVDPNSGETREIGEGAGPVLQATPAPDGSMVVWTGEEEVVVWDDGATHRLDSPMPPFFYLFSPRGDRIAALGNDPRGGGVALASIDTAAGTVRLVDAGQPYYISWSPDGDELVAHIGAELITRVALDGARQGLDVTAGGFQAPHWRADGTIVAVVVTEGLTADASATVQATESWLAVLDGAGEILERVAPVGPAVSFDVTANGARVAYVEGSGAGGLAIGPVRVAEFGGDRRMIHDGTVVALEWSPDDQHLLFLELDSEQGLVPHVWDGEQVTDYPGFDPTEVFLGQYLPFWSQYSQSITHWAPDSSAFAYAAVSAEGEGEIWIQPVVEERRRSTPGEMVVWSP